MAFLFGLSILWEVLTTGKQVPGYPSLVIGLMTIGGVQLIMIGIVGEYIGKILSELKARPIYFVAEHSEKRADDGRRSERQRTDRGRMNDAAPLRRIWLCADDYGLSRGRQPRHSRPDRARPAQCDFGDGGGRSDRARRGRGAARASPPRARAARSACTRR